MIEPEYRAFNLTDRTDRAIFADLLEERGERADWIRWLRSNLALAWLPDDKLIVGHTAELIWLAETIKKETDWRKLYETEYFSFDFRGFEGGKAEGVRFTLESLRAFYGPPSEWGESSYLHDVYGRLLEILEELIGL